MQHCERFVHPGSFAVPENCSWLLFPSCALPNTISNHELLDRKDLRAQLRGSICSQIASNVVARHCVPLSGYKHGNTV